MTAPAVTILHLSDLHFGRKHRFERDGFGSLLSRITLDLTERAATDGLVPDIVVVSGDFAELGKRDELDQALTFLRGLKAHLDLPARRFVMVPGNHDVNWNKSRAYFEDRAGDGLLPEEPYFRKFEHYKRFFDSFYEGEEGIRFTEEEPWSWFEMPDLGVVAAGLNSAYAESHQDTDHHGFLGERQIRAIAGRMKAFQERGSLRIAVLHHDPFDKRGGPRADQDQKDFRRWLVPSVNLILHGDIHEETCRHLEREVPAIGVGSAAVGVDERGPDVSNEYQILVVRPDGVERHLRAWVSDQRRWVESPRADLAGASGKTFIKADFDAVTALGKRTAPPPKVDLAAVVERYRASLVRRQGSPTVFDLLGVGENEESGGLDFLRLFVPQTATWDRSAADRRASRGVASIADNEDAWAPSLSALLGVPARAPAEPRPEATFLPERPRTVDELLDRPRLLIVGAPGAGKSALTRWLCLKLSVPGESLFGVPQDTVPVLVELRSFDQAHQATGAGYTVFDHVARMQADFHGSLAAEHLRALSADGRVLWLFDGLDEIADSTRRRDMAERIAGLLDEHDRCRVIVTSRIAGVDVARPILEGAAFQTLRLRDFNVSQRDQFLHAWHDLMFRRDPAVGVRRREHMAAAIGSTPSLQELCKSPLLCSMLAYLHREESLPKRRHLLYQKVLERMAEHWDANKGLPPRPPHEQFELEDKLMFLRRLAWHMLAGEQRSMIAIHRSKLEDFATGFCESRWGQTTDTAQRRAEALIQDLHMRRGPLIFLGADAFGFAHRTFLEFFAASEAMVRFRSQEWGEENIGRLFAERWREPRWEEPLFLLCGLLLEDREHGGACVARALQTIGDGRPSHIAERAPEELHRKHARHALDLYGEINALLQVGRLRRARVRFEGQDVGTLEELTRVGNGTLFRYDKSYTGPAISPNMPVGEPYKDEHGLLPFFANLLPEGALYEQTARKLGLKRTDKLGVLLRVGADTMGAVEILPMEPA